MRSRAGLRLPVLGLIERNPKAWPNPYAPQLVTIQDPCSRASEAFHALRTKVQASLAQRSMHTVLVIGPEHTAGQSSTAANLAVTLAQTGTAVVLLDVSLRQTRMRRLLAQHAGTGLMAALQQPDDASNDAWVRALVMTGVKNLTTVTAEPPEDTRAVSAAPDLAALLGSPQMQAFLRHLQTVGECIVIDAPALPASETMALARQAESAILVIEYNRTRHRAAQRAIHQLQQAGTHVLGAVLTEVPSRRPIDSWG